MPSQQQRHADLPMAFVIGLLLSFPLVLLIWTLGQWGLGVEAMLGTWVIIPTYIWQQERRRKEFKAWHDAQIAEMESREDWDA